MKAALLVVLVVVPGLAGPAAAAPPPWCEEARALLHKAPAAGDEAWPRYLEVTARFPRGADAVVEAARSRAGEDASLGQALGALLAAVEDGCREPAPAPAAADLRAEVQALMSGDERFAGARYQPGLFDQLKADLARWLQELLESQLMRRYAGASRTVYLSLLALFLVYVGVRLWRARVRERVAAARRGEHAHLERERRVAFAEHRRQAADRLAAGDARGALRAGQLALLARIGEVERGAVTPARTLREVLARLEQRRRALVAPPLSLFERAYFGGHADEAAASSFLAAVDTAAAGLEEAA